MPSICGRNLWFQAAGASAECVVLRQTYIFQLNDSIRFLTVPQFNVQMQCVHGILGRAELLLLIAPAILQGFLNLRRRRMCPSSFTFHVLFLYVHALYFLYVCFFSLSQEKNTKCFPIRADESQSSSLVECDASKLLVFSVFSFFSFRHRITDIWQIRYVLQCECAFWQTCKMMLIIIYAFANIRSFHLIDELSPILKMCFYFSFSSHSFLNRIRYYWAINRKYLVHSFRIIFVYIFLFQHNIY